MLTIKDGIVASALSILNQVTRRLMGIVSLVILARVLTPEDFGLVAIALIFMNFVNVVTSIGSDNYLMSQESINDEMVQTCWTLGFFLKTPFALGLAIGSPFIANYYADPRLTPILLMFSLQSFIGTLASPGLIYKRKNQQLKEITQWQIASRFVISGVTIGIAVIFRSYWALVIGQFLIVVSHVCSTYYIAPLKPRFSFANVRPQWEFSKWIMPQSIINFFRSQLDAIYVSSVFDKASMGAYNSMRYYALIPSETFITPILSPLLAQFSQLKTNHEYYRKQVQVAFFVIFVMSLPIIYLMNSQADYVVSLLLGDKWVSYSALLGIFSFFTFVSVINNTVGQIIMLNNNTRLLLIYSVVSIIGNIAMFTFFDFDSIFQLATYKMGLDIILAFIFFILVVAFLLGRSTLFHVMHPIIIASCCMLFAGYVSQNLPTLNHDFLNFIFYCSVTVLVYSTTLLGVVYVLRGKVHCYSYTFNAMKKSMFFVKSKLRG